MNYENRNYASVARSWAAAAALAVSAAVTQSLLASPANARGGGVGPGDEPAPAEGDAARIVDGRAVPPATAPRRVARAIEAANRIVKGKPYCYGGGHGEWESRCYDCSGAVSYALGAPGAGLIDSPMPSGAFMEWAKRGRGSWITVYANRHHMYAVIAGLRLDTARTRGNGPGWSTRQVQQRRFRVRHPQGL